MCTALYLEKQQMCRRWGVCYYTTFTLEWWTSSPNGIVETFRWFSFFTHHLSVLCTISLLQRKSDSFFLPNAERCIAFHFVWIQPNWDFLASVIVNMMHSCLGTADKRVLVVFRFKTLSCVICFNLCHFCKKQRLRCQLLPQLRFLSPLPDNI